jgi:uncharacterized protein YbbK (DUF523 family)
VILVSACLVGQHTRYDANHALNPELTEYLQGRAHLALCPELLAGLGVPRAPVKIQGGRQGQEGRDVLQGRAKVIDSQGRDLTGPFIKGAELVARTALQAGVKRCFLKDRSPSCAWDPQGENPKGGPRLGVLTALLLDAGLEVVECRSQAAPR